MDLEALTEAMHTFVQSKGWYQPDSPRAQTPRNIALSLTIEAAEVLEHFQWQEHPIDKAACAAELADVMLYLLQLASLLQIDLSQAVLAKLAHNYQRDWLPAVAPTGDSCPPSR